MIGVDNQVKSHEFPELLILKSQLSAVVGRVVKVGISVSNSLSVSVVVVINKSSNSGDFGAEVKSILKRCFPELRFVNTTLVGLHEFRVWLAHESTS